MARWLRRAPRRIDGRAVILEADDLGLLYAFNEGIRLAHQHGGLTSTCLRANGHAYDHAINEIIPDCPDLGVGIHLCLNEAGCVAPRDRVAMLLGPDGRQRPGYLWLMKLVRSAEGRAQIERELRAQIEKVLLDGVRVDHLNSHQHVHMIPEIFRITCRLAREYEIDCVRLAREPSHFAGSLLKRVEPLVNTNYIKHHLLNRFACANVPVARAMGIRTTDAFVGVNYTGAMTLDTLRAGLNAAGYGSVEVLLHPTTTFDARDEGLATPYYRRYVDAFARRQELATLTAEQLPEALRRGHRVATTYETWANQPTRPLPVRRAVEADEAARRLVHDLRMPAPPWVSGAYDHSRIFAQLVMAEARPGRRILDMGTGTGIVGIALAKAGHRVVATDSSAPAVRTARANAARHGVTLDARVSDLLDSVDGRFDLIAFNLPYNFAPDTFWSNVAKNALRRIPWVHRNGGRMPQGVIRFHQTLCRRLFREAPEHLTPDGAILLYVFEAEVPTLIDLLPADADVELLEHADRDAKGPMGMLIRLPVGVTSRDH